MSPNCDHFVELCEITPGPVKAADKALFMAAGIGSMKINVSNGKGITLIMLKNILSCPDLAFTLISLSKCDAAGFTVTLKNHEFLISDPKVHYWPDPTSMYMVLLCRS